MLPERAFVAQNYERHQRRRAQPSPPQTQPSLPHFDGGAETAIEVKAQSVIGS